MKLVNNVFPLGAFTKLHVDVDNVLEGAKGKLSDVLVIGHEGDSIYFASSTSDTAELNLLVDKFKFMVMRGDFN